MEDRKGDAATVPDRNGNKRVDIFEATILKRAPVSLSLRIISFGKIRKIVVGLSYLSG